MSQNFGNNDPQNKGGQDRTTGGAGTGATDAGTTRETATGGGLTTTGGGATTGGGNTAATGTATAREGLTGTAQEYGQKIADAATTAKDYVSDKISVAGDKFKDLQNVDYRQV